ncbi:MAG: type II toxin-antitoxin system VapC family toxin [Candidatus Korarchaeota archaeon]|nr:type II toxin-antitoxin system VapC family toxin [Candidatus Korarchaeota archaeon]
MLDASAAAKWFVKEEGSEEMSRVREKIVKEELKGYAPEFILIEIANLLRYAKNATPDDAQNAVRSLEILLSLEEDRKLLQGAIELAFKESITVYDSLYVALARSLGTRLVTCDEELLTKFDGLAIRADKLWE